VNPTGAYGTLSTRIPTTAPAESTSTTTELTPPSHIHPLNQILQSSPQARQVMKVRIKKWNAVASWRWDVPEDDVCGICRVQFDGTCPNCRFPGDDCPLRLPLPPHLALPSFPYDSRDWANRQVLMISSCRKMRTFVSLGS